MTDLYQPDPGAPAAAPARPGYRTSPWRLLLAATGGAALVGALWAGLGLAGSGGPAGPSGDTFDLRGTFTLTSGGDGFGTCVGSGGYADIAGGAAVTVYDAAGSVLSRGALGTGRPAGMGTCVFSLSAQSVPAGEQIYLVEVAHRGRTMVTPQDARDGNVALSLGG
ncbi:hypothetical protein OHS58_28815 [Amycolatopsis sp. NBC_00348]|uniref:hypothetical protein n=1 Tax=Amycolatopsis sp. NBC_00348 TaxID=2975956 RepID=UPI002E27258A